jgi:hypothetical protein
MFPCVDSDPTGRFIVVWQSWEQDNSGYGIIGRRYSSQGVPLGGELQINNSTYGNQERPVVEIRDDASFIVAWQALGQDGSSYGVYAREFDGEGNPSGDEFLVNAETEGWQGNPSLAAGPEGTFVVAWESEGVDGDDHAVVARRFGSGGIPLGSEVTLNTYIESDQILPSLATDSTGEILAAWSSEGQDGHSFGVYARRFSADLEPLSEEVRVNTCSYRDQMSPCLALAPGGDIAVIWMSSQDGSGLGVYGQMYHPNGQPWGGEFQVNEHTFLYQSFPDVACSQNGMMVVWQSDCQDGDRYGIYGRLYSSGEMQRHHLTGGSIETLIDEILGRLNRWRW